MFGVCLVVFSFRLYNQSCEEELYLQSGPSLCCTLDNVPLIRSVRWSRTVSSLPLCFCWVRTGTLSHCFAWPLSAHCWFKKKKASEEKETFLLCVCVHSENNLWQKYPACHRGSLEAKHGPTFSHVNTHTHTEESAYSPEEMKTLLLLCLGFWPSQLSTSKTCCTT